MLLLAFRRHAHGLPKKEDATWAPIRRNFVQCYSVVAQVLKKKQLAEARLFSASAPTSTKPPIYYESDRWLLDEVWELTRAHREELVAIHQGQRERRLNGPSVLEMLRVTPVP